MRRNNNPFFCKNIFFDYKNDRIPKAPNLSKKGTTNHETEHKEQDTPYY
ncbi:hypothetical protein [Sunxiuqinia rutila]